MVNQVCVKVSVNVKDQMKCLLSVTLTLLSVPLFAVLPLLIRLELGMIKLVWLALHLVHHGLHYGKVCYTDLEVVDSREDGIGNFHLLRLVHATTL